MYKQRIAQSHLLQIATHYGTPAYVYCRQAIETAASAYLAHANDSVSVHYAVKANGHIAIINLLARLGMGFDIVSLGELERCLVAGADVKKIIYSGVGKQRHEIQAALAADIYAFNIESAAELSLLIELAAEQEKKPNVFVRLNPNVDAGSHANINTGLGSSKFGVDSATAFSVYQRASQDSRLHPLGISCHIGSNIHNLNPYFAAWQQCLQLRTALRDANLPCEHINMGGGLGINDEKDTTVAIHTLCNALCTRARDAGVTLLLEPGRSIIGPAGLLLTRVLHIKQTPNQTFVVVDAAMNDYLRPALYNASQPIGVVAKQSQRPAWHAAIVGPVCEPTDCFATSVSIACQPDDLLSIHNAGAYGAVMASNYNARLSAAEIMCDAGRNYCITARQTISSLYANERFCV